MQPLTSGVCRKAGPRWVLTPMLDIPKVGVSGGPGRSAAPTRLDGDGHDEGRRVRRSLSKAFVTLAALVAVRDGTLTLDEPVATYWPEYGRRGKERTTLRHVLTHRAGRPRFPDTAAELDLLDDAGLRDSLAQAAPEYVPGTFLGEHALTYGHLVDGILRAGAGTTLGGLFNDVVRPALALDAWFGVPDGSLDRVADLEYAYPQWPRQLHAAPWLQIPAGVLDTERTNSRAWRQSVFGAVNLTPPPRPRPGSSPVSPARTDRCENCSAHSCTLSFSAPKSPNTTRSSARGSPGAWASSATRERSPRARSAAVPPGGRCGTTGRPFAGPRRQ